MMVCIFPVLFVVILLPVFVRLSNRFLLIRRFENTAFSPLPRRTWRQILTTLA